MSKKVTYQDCSAKNAVKYLLQLDNLSRTFALESPHVMMLYRRKEFTDNLWINILREQANTSACYRRKLTRRLGEYQDERTIAHLNLADNLVKIYGALRHWRMVQYQRRHYAKQYAEHIDNNRRATRAYLDSGDPELVAMVSAGRNCNELHQSLEKLSGDLVVSLHKLGHDLLIIAYDNQIPDAIESGFNLAGEFETKLDHLADLRSRCQPPRALGIDSYPYETEMMLYQTMIGSKDERGWYDLHTDAIVAHERYATAVAAVDDAIRETF